MNLPITLTLLRIFFVPLLVVLLLTKGQNLDLWAVGVFLAAAMTDLLDGYFARRRRQITTLGILLDPIADKLLTSAAFISLVELGLAPAWMVVIIVGREFAVSGLRAIASAQGYVLQASDLGKSKMVLQEDHFLFLQGFHLGYILLWLVVLFALVSAGQYFWDFRRKLESGHTRPVRGGVVIYQPGKQEVEEAEREERDVATH
jgi:CDP-diacylglycerol--glycerol-3-phosphate 3-phosphatidyltransferase